MYHCNICGVEVSDDLCVELCVSAYGSSVLVGHLCIECAHAKLDIEYRRKQCITKKD